MIKRLIMFCIDGVRPLLGPAYCYYKISCTEFARQQLATENLFLALWRIMKRVISCNPFFMMNKNMLKKFFIIISFFASFQLNKIYAIAELQTESVSVSDCDVELVRSEIGLRRIITYICNNLGVTLDGEPKIHSSKEGFTYIQATKPRAVITLFTDNATNSISCTISTHNQLLINKKALKQYIENFLHNY
jgi:putative component of membrane protein insertase Oxa1/YidC/SpoIIIJ protein YidD